MGNHPRIILLLAHLLLLWCSGSFAYDIVFFTPFTTRSETILYYPICKELAQRGHNVTVVSPFPLRGDPVPGLNLIRPPNLIEANGETFVDGRVEGSMTGGEWEMMEIAMAMGMDVCKGIFRNTTIIPDLLKTHKSFDLVIVGGSMNECGMPLAHHYKAPFVLIDTAGLHPWHTKTSGNVYLPSVTTNIIGSDLTDEMSLWQRIDNLFRLLMWNWMRERIFLDPMDKLIESSGHFHNVPPLFELEKDVSMILLYRNPLMEFPTSTLSNVVKLRCVHCRPSKPLPKDLADFVDKSGDAGFIYFSFGSFAKLNSSREYFRKHFFTAFAQLPQRFLVKWDTPVSNEEIGAPPNVMISHWLPQQDIIGHPKCRAFITHGGLFSTLESLYHGVPLVIFPLFWDQHHNARVAEKLGIGVKLEITQISSEKLLAALETVTKYPAYRENSRQKSLALKDVLVDPMDEAVFWLEYVIRHKGTQFISPVAARIPWYQIYMVDIFVLFTVLVLTALYILCKIIKVLLKIFKAARKSAKIPKKKRQ